MDDILWAKSENKYICIQTSQKSFLLRTTIDAFIEEHQLEGMIRVHRSYVVNVSKIGAYAKGIVTVNGNKIPVSRKYTSDLGVFLK